ncbi:MAG: hypothetical protein WCF78_04505 [archaeon]
MISTAAIAINTESKKIKNNDKRVVFKLLKNMESMPCAHNQH